MILVTSLFLYEDSFFKKMKEILKEKYIPVPRCLDSSSFLKRKCIPVFLINLFNIVCRILQKFPEIEIIWFKSDFKQNFLKEMQKALILVLLSATALTFSNYTHTINTASADCWATYPLGSVTSGDTITFLLQFPNATTGVSPTAFQAFILNSQNAPIANQPAGFNTSVNVTFQGSNTLTWNVGVNGSFYFKIQSSSSASSFVPYQLTATSSNRGTLVKTSDALRQILFLKIYLASSPTRYVISRNNTDRVSTRLFLLVNNTFSVEPVRPTFFTSTEYIYTNILAGQYILKVDSRSPIAISYQSDPYVCPYDPNFPDTKLLYKPCFFNAAPAAASSQSSGMPIGHIILIGACSGVFVVAAVGVLIYLLKEKVSNVTPEVYETTEATFSTSKAMNPTLKTRNSELIKVEVPKTVLNFQKP